MTSPTPPRHRIDGSLWCLALVFLMFLGAVAAIILWRLLGGSLTDISCLGGIVIGGLGGAALANFLRRRRSTFAGFLTAGAIAGAIVGWLAICAYVFSRDVEDRYWLAPGRQEAWILGVTICGTITGAAIGAAIELIWKADRP